MNRMSDMERYSVQIDHLPEEVVEADSPEDASRKVSEIILARDALHDLPDEEPVQIKRPDRTPWGRNLTIGDFRRGPVQVDPYPAGAPGEGPVRRPDTDD